MVTVVTIIVIIMLMFMIETDVDTLANDAIGIFTLRQTAKFVKIALLMILLS